jgi:hypothetical protein
VPGSGGDVDAVIVSARGPSSCRACLACPAGLLAILKQPWPKYLSDTVNVSLGSIGESRSQQFMQNSLNRVGAQQVGQSGSSFWREIRKC